MRPARTPHGGTIALHGLLGGLARAGGDERLLTVPALVRGLREKK